MSAEIICDQCNGTKTVPITIAGETAQFECPICNGSGHKIVHSDMLQTRDLAVLVRRLCRVVARHDPNNVVRAEALDCLHRKGFGGSSLLKTLKTNELP